jgi:hypothetical protein
VGFQQSIFAEAMVGWRIKVWTCLLRMRMNRTSLIALAQGLRYLINVPRQPYYRQSVSRVLPSVGQQSRGTERDHVSLPFAAQFFYISKLSSFVVLSKTVRFEGACVGFTSPLTPVSRDVTVGGAGTALGF